MVRAAMRSSTLVGRATSVHAIDAERRRFCCAFLGTRRRLLSRVIDPVGPNEEVSRNFPSFTQLVDHVDRERAPPSENFWMHASNAIAGSLLEPSDRSRLNHAAFPRSA